MRRRDDDLSPFRNAPLFRALTGPATPDELAGEADALAAFREANVGRPRRRMVARVGTSGAVAAVAVVLSGTAAAAYTASLPAPVQRTLHDAFGPLGVPAPQHHHPTPVAVSTTPSPVPSPMAAPLASGAPPSAVHPSPLTSSGAPTTRPTTSVSPTTSTIPVVVTTPTSSPTPSPTSSGQAPLPGATLVITTSDSEVVVGTSVTITGTLTDETGNYVVGRAVVLAEHLPGEPGWTKSDPMVTSATGTVAFPVTALARNARFVLRAGGHVHSSVVSVQVEPTIAVATASSSADSSETTVTVTVVGAQAGDAVVLERIGRHKMTRSAELGTTGEVTFTVPSPTRHVVRYRAVVRRTEAHLMKSASVEVSPPEQPTS